MTIAPTNCNGLTLGSTGCATTISGNLTVTGKISTPIPLTMTYTTLPTFTSGQIGYTSTFLSDTSGSLGNANTFKTLYTWSTPPIGVFLVEFSMSFTSGSTLGLSISTSATAYDYAHTTTIYDNLYIVIPKLTTVIQTTSATLYAIATSQTTANLAYSHCYLIITRIA